MRPLPHVSFVLSLLAAASFGSGCMFSSLDPTQQLTNQVHQMNDEMRWARVDLASQQVSPDYRETFLASHRLWGSDIQIADAEATNIAIAEDSATATATVRVSWYDERTMEVHGTVVQQHFVQSGDGYLLDEETITSGDRTLLLLPEEDEQTEPGPSAG